MSLLPSPCPPCACAVHCHFKPCPLYIEPYFANTSRPQTWSVLMVVLAIGPGLDSVRQSWRIQALPRLPVPIHRTYQQLHGLHWPQQPYLRSLRDSGDIRPGWDREPLLRYLRGNTEGPGPPSGLGHQDRRSPQDLDPSRHLPQLMRAHHPSFHQPRGSGAPCSPVTRFRVT